VNDGEGPLRPGRWRWERRGREGIDVAFHFIKITDESEITHDGEKVTFFSLLNHRTHGGEGAKASHLLQVMSTSSVLNLCVVVVSSSGVRWPIRYWRRPAWAIMMPLSMQNLNGDGSNRTQ
jgi:hypothetical protein